jgi:hypothetical protein
VYSIGPYQFTETDAGSTVMLPTRSFIYASQGQAEVIEHLGHLEDRAAR